MGHITYRVVEHEGGWAYQQGGTFSEAFDSHDAARAAASQACRHQMAPGETGEIEYQNASGQWVTECAQGDDRPDISVEG